MKHLDNTWAILEISSKNLNHPSEPSRILETIQELKQRIPSQRILLLCDEDFAALDATWIQTMGAVLIQPSHWGNALSLYWLLRKIEIQDPEARVLFIPEALETLQDFSSKSIFQTVRRHAEESRLLACTSESKNVVAVEAPVSLFLLLYCTADAELANFLLREDFSDRHALTFSESAEGFSAEDFTQSILVPQAYYVHWEAIFEASEFPAHLPAIQGLQNWSLEIEAGTAGAWLH